MEKKIDPLDERLAELSSLLKQEVALYGLEGFTGFFSYFIKYRPDGDNGFMEHFESILKDFMYLIALNVFSGVEGTKDIAAGDAPIVHWASVLTEIKDIYKKKILGDYLNEDNGLQRAIHQACFHTYFENGALSYVEQDIDRIRRIFTRFDPLIKEDFGFDVDFLVKFYEFSEKLTASKYFIQQEFSRDERFHQTMMLPLPLSKRLAMLPEDVRARLDRFRSCTHESLKFRAEEFYGEFPPDSVDKLIDLLKTVPRADESFLFYASQNPLDVRPIIDLGKGNLLFPYQRCLPIAISNFLYRHLIAKKELKDRLRRHRDKVLEEKTADIFREFFSKEKNVAIFTGYRIDENTEQDLLVICGRSVFIVEIKGSSYREPFRNAEKGFERIKADFKDSIQYGYDQCLRVEDWFYGEDKFYVHQGKERHLVDPDNFDAIYSIVVTLERFGPIQTDLNLLLNKPEECGFPWSVYIDDLETILLSLKKLSQAPLHLFKTYLEGREKINGRMYASDELDICATFLSNRKLFHDLVRDPGSSATFSPTNQLFFDELYFCGLGLDNELYLEEKRRRKFVPPKQIGGFKFELPKRNKNV